MKRGRREYYAARRQTRPCEWCGAPITRSPSAFGQHAACDISHAGYARWWRRDQCRPRPLLVQRLRDLCRDRRLTYENVAKQAGKIGAREPEILAVLT